MSFSLADDRAQAAPPLCPPAGAFGSELPLGSFHGGGNVAPSTDDLTMSLMRQEHEACILASKECSKVRGDWFQLVDHVKSISAILRFLASNVFAHPGLVRQYQTLAAPLPEFSTPQLDLSKCHAPPLWKAVTE